MSGLCCMLAMSRSDRQEYGCYWRRKNREEDPDGGQNQRREEKDEYTHVLPVPGTSTNTCYLVVLCVF